MTAYRKFTLDQIVDPVDREVAGAIGRCPNEDGMSMGTLLRECPSLMGKNRMLAWRRLKNLVESGLITASGSTKQTRYVPSEDLRMGAMRELLTSDMMRDPVNYQFEFLEEYVPNKSQYLRQADMNRLMERAAQGSYAKNTIGERDMRRFMADFAYASSRLEGVDYGLLDTRSFLEQGNEIMNIGARDRQTLMNHYQASQFLLRGISWPPREKDLDLKTHDLRSIHALLSHNLLKRTDLQGALRTTTISIERTAFRPLQVGFEIANQLQLMTEKARQIKNPYEASIFVLIHLPYIQPFIDCNKRCARLAANIPLLRAGILPVSWLDTQRDDFNLAVISVYEQQDVRFMSDVFTRGCLMSFEQYESTRVQREPDNIAITYASEVRECIRAQFANGSFATPASVPPEREQAFSEHVAEMTNAIFENPFVGLTYDLAISDVMRQVAERGADAECEDASLSSPAMGVV